MKIDITVWKMQSRYGDDNNVENILHVRYPDINRKKGEPHDIQKYHHVECLSGFELNAINKINKSGAYCYYPDYKEIDKIIDSYRNIGTVNVFYNEPRE